MVTKSLTLMYVFNVVSIHDDKWTKDFRSTSSYPRWSSKYASNFRMFCYSKLKSDHVVGIHLCYYLKSPPLLKFLEKFLLNCFAFLENL